MAHIDAEGLEGDPAMFIRAHKKSRSGCLTCKMRKVKCDERRPLCRNCARRCPVELIACDFPSNIKHTELHKKPCRKLISRQDAPKPVLQVINNYPVGIKTDDNKYRRLELRLLHHYITATCQGLPNAGASDRNRIWSQAVPQIGYISDLVLDGMLAFAALHLNTLIPESPELEVAETKYVARVINSQRKALTELNKKDPQEVFTTALFLFHYIWLTENQAAVKEPYHLPTKIFHLARGSKILFHSLPYISLDYYEIYCPVLDVARAARPYQDEFIENTLIDLEHLAAVLNNRSIASIDDQAVIKETLQNLIVMVHTFAASESVSSSQYNFAFLTMRSPHRFVGLLEEQQPFAMAILARNFALIHVMDRTWWMHGLDGMDLAARNVKGIAGMMPKRFQWMMSWPLDVVGRRKIYKTL